MQNSFSARPPQTAYATRRGISDDRRGAVPRADVGELGRHGGQRSLRRRCAGALRLPDNCVRPNRSWSSRLCPERCWSLNFAASPTKGPQRLIMASVRRRKELAVYMPLTRYAEPAANRQERASRSDVA